MRSTLVALALLGCAAPPVPAETVELRLHEAIALAIRDSISVRNTYLDRISQKFSLEVARDNFRPQLSLSGSAGFDSSFDTSQHARLTDRAAGVGATVSLNVPTGGQLALTVDNQGTLPEQGTDSFAANVNLSFSQPLLRGGGTTVGTAALVQAERAEQANLHGLRQALISLAGDVINQYRSYALILRSLEIDRISLERSRRQVDINAELIKAGRLPRVELIQSETDVANRELAVRSAENQAKSALLTLLRLLRLDEDTRLVLSEPVQVVAVTMELDEALRTAFDNRPDYLQSLLRLRDAELQKKLAENEQRWDLNLTANYNLQGNARDVGRAFSDFGPMDQGGYAIGLDLSIPIDDLNRKQSLVSARIGLIQASNSHIDLKEQIRVEIIDALSNINILWDEVKLAKRALELSRRQLEIEEEKLVTGRSSNFQVVSFKNDLVNAENTYLSAQVSYLNALTALDSSLGTTLGHWGISVEPGTGLGIDDIEGYGVTSR